MVTFSGLYRAVSGEMVLFPNGYKYFFDASNWQLLFQDPASPVMEVIVEFHHDVMFLFVFIVLYMLGSVFFVSQSNKPRPQVLMGVDFIIPSVSNLPPQVFFIVLYILVWFFLISPSIREPSPIRTDEIKRLSVYPV